MGTTANSNENGSSNRYLQVEHSGTLSYSLSDDPPTKMVSEIRYEFECAAGLEGKCAVSVLGSTSLTGLVEIVEEHHEIHLLPGEETAAREALGIPLTPV